MTRYADQSRWLHRDAPDLPVKPAVCLWQNGRAHSQEAPNSNSSLKFNGTALINPTKRPPEVGHLPRRGEL